MRRLQQRLPEQTTPGCEDQEGDVREGSRQTELPVIKPWEGAGKVCCYGNQGARITLCRRLQLVQTPALFYFTMTVSFICAGALGDEEGLLYHTSPPLAPQGCPMALYSVIFLPHRISQALLWFILALLCRWNSPLAHRSWRTGQKRLQTTWCSTLTADLLFFTSLFQHFLKSSLALQWPFLQFFSGEKTKVHCPNFILGCLSPAWWFSGRALYAGGPGFESHTGSGRASSVQTHGKSLWWPLKLKKLVLRLASHQQLQHFFY